MRVAVVCGHFMPEVGYQEVWIARTLARLGVHVRVVTSTGVSSSARRVRRAPYPAGLFEMPDGYEVVRLPVAFRFRSAVLSRGVAQAVQAWHPDAIVLIGVGKLFGVPVLRAPALQEIPIVCFFSELAEYRHRHSWAARTVAWLQDRGFELFKRRWYRRAISRAQLLVCNSPGTVDWLHACCRTQEEHRAVEAKARVLTLGYDSRLFFFSSDERRQARGALGIRDNEVLVLTITRVVPHKRLERIIDAVGLLQQQGLPAWYSLVGGLGDTYERELRQRMARQPIPERFVLLPFSSAEQLRCLAAAADIGVWMQIAISLTEAMGTGLPILLPWRLSLSHLVQHGENGWYWDEPHGFEAALAEAVAFLQSMEEQHRCQWRQAVAQHNAERFAYEAILSRVFKQLGFSIP